jgi:hypothetical protein
MDPAGVIELTFIAAHAAEHFINIHKLVANGTNFQEVWYIMGHNGAVKDSGRKCNFLP